MKRSIFILLTATFVVGCQSPAGLQTSGVSSVGVSQRNAKCCQLESLQPIDELPSLARLAPDSRDFSGREIFDPNLRQVGYDRGPGAKRNMAFVQKIGRAVPSSGGQLPGVATGGGMPIGYQGPRSAGGSPRAHHLPPQLIGLGPRFTSGRSQIRFVDPAGMKIAWQTDMKGGQNQFTSPQLQSPARYNFMQGQIYRLKLIQIPNRPGIELYPTLEIYPGNVKVAAYLSHNAIPISFGDEDFDQVLAGNYVTKVIYLPDPKFQELAIAGVETLVSTRLDPGIDPVGEAHRRGSILAVVRIGSVDLEMPHSPSLFGDQVGNNTTSKPGPSLAPIVASSEPRISTAKKVSFDPTKSFEANLAHWRTDSEDIFSPTMISTVGFESPY